jgi:hypothetical protein
MKYGVTLRTTQRRLHATMRPAPDSVHNVVLSKGQTKDQAQGTFNTVAYALRYAMGRNPSSTHSSGRHINSVEYLVQNGEPGDDLLLFIDTYEDE